MFQNIFICSCRLVVDWQLARNEASKSGSSIEPSKAQDNAAETFDQTDNDLSDSETETSYMKTRSGRNVNMAQKKDQ